MHELPLSDISRFFLHPDMTLDQILTKHCFNCRNYCLLGNTNSKLIRCKDSICVQQVKGFQDILCLRYSATLPISSVMFTCDDLANNPQPTSTFTATATRIAGWRQVQLKERMPQPVRKFRLQRRLVGVCRQLPRMLEIAGVLQEVRAAQARRV